MAAATTEVMHDDVDCNAGSQGTIRGMSEAKQMEMNWPEPDEEENSLTTRSIEVLRGCFVCYYFGLREGELRSHIISLMEEYGYHFTMKSSEYYEPAPENDAKRNGATGFYKSGQCKIQNFTMYVQRMRMCGALSDFPFVDTSVP